MAIQKEKQEELLDYLANNEKINDTWALLFEASPEIKQIFYDNAGFAFSLIQTENKNVEIDVKIHSFDGNNSPYFSCNVRDSVFQSSNIEKQPNRSENIDYIVDNIRYKKLWELLKQNFDQFNDKLNNFYKDKKEQGDRQVSTLNDRQIEKKYKLIESFPLLIKIIFNPDNRFNECLSEKFFNNDNDQNFKQQVFDFLNPINLPLNITRPNIYSKNEMPMLHSAVYSDNVILTRFLLQNGADIEQKDQNNNTPLFFADSVEMLDELKKYKPDLEAVNNDDQKAYDIVVDSKNGIFKREFQNHDIWNNSQLVIKDRLLESFKEDRVSEFKKLIKEENVDLNMEIKGYPLIMNETDWGKASINQKLAYLMTTDMDCSVQDPVTHIGLMPYTVSMISKPYGNNQSDFKNRQRAFDKVQSRLETMGFYNDLKFQSNFLIDMYKTSILKNSEKGQVFYFLNEANELDNEYLGIDPNYDLVDYIKNNKVNFEEDRNFGLSLKPEKDKRDSDSLDKKTRNLMKSIDEKYNTASDYSFHNESLGQDFLNRIQFIKKQAYINGQIKVVPEQINRMAWCLDIQQNKELAFAGDGENHIEMYQKEALDACKNNNMEELGWALLNAYNYLIVNAYPKKSFFANNEKINITTSQQETIDKTKLNEQITIYNKMPFGDFVHTNFSNILYHCSDDLRLATIQTKDIIQQKMNKKVHMRESINDNDQFNQFKRIADHCYLTLNYNNVDNNQRKARKQTML